jgi:hypothetical protein
VSAPAAAAIDDAAFNALLGEFVELTRRVLTKSDRDRYDLMVVLAHGADHRYRTLEHRGDGGPSDLLDLMRGFGAQLKLDGAPFDAVLVASEMPGEDGSGTLVITGATADGRRNGAVIELRRESDGSLRVRTVKLQPYAPHTWVMQPKRHPAGALIEGWLAATTAASPRPWWRFWG